MGRSERNHGTRNVRTQRPNAPPTVALYRAALAWLRVRQRIDPGDPRIYEPERLSVAEVDMEAIFIILCSYL